MIKDIVIAVVVIAVIAYVGYAFHTTSRKDMDEMEKDKDLY